MTNLNVMDKLNTGYALATRDNLQKTNKPHTQTFCVVSFIGYLRIDHCNGYYPLFIRCIHQY